MSKKTINMALNFEQLMRAFFGLGDDVDFHCIDCRLVSGSYVNTEVSSQVIIEFNKSSTFSVRCKRSKHNSLQSSFVHLTALLEPFLHEPFSCSILPFYPVQIDFLSYCSNTQPSVFSNHISHFFNVVISNSCAWTAWVIIIFHAFSAFQKSFVPFKHACMRHAIFTVSLSQ